MLPRLIRWLLTSSALAVWTLTLLPSTASAIPVFARQTGQNCVACHAGGQFPELTPYGRLFKLTGYTQGVRTTVPLSVMGVASMAKVSSTNGSAQPPVDFPRDGSFDITTGSLFCCGKLTDNLGLFAQWTYDVYDHMEANGNWVGRAHTDQVDFRFADRFVDTNSDLIYGFSLNNNPGVSDVWNTHNSAFTPVPSYVPASNAIYGGGVLPGDVPGTMIQGLGQVSAGLTAYAFWNNTLYAELGTYKAAVGGLSVFSAQDLDQMGTRLFGSYNPYWRLAYNHDWNANSAMIGVHGMNSKVYNDPVLYLTSAVSQYHDTGIDGQYQYLLDPHAFTAMFSLTHEEQNGVPGATNQTNTLNYLRLKASYVYNARFGGSLAYTSASGSSDPTLYGGNTVTRPDSKLWVPEVFFMPVQYVRMGLQYYKWTEVNGSSTNYDASGLTPGRNAADNNTLFFYIWAAY